MKVKIELIHISDSRVHNDTILNKTVVFKYFKEKLYIGEVIYLQGLECSVLIKNFNEYGYTVNVPINTLHFLCIVFPCLCEFNEIDSFCVFKDISKCKEKPIQDIEEIMQFMLIDLGYTSFDAEIIDYNDGTGRIGTIQIRITNFMFYYNYFIEKSNLDYRTFMELLLFTGELKKKQEIKSQLKLI